MLAQYVPEAASSWPDQGFLMQMLQGFLVSLLSQVRSIYHGGVYSCIGLAGSVESL